MTAFTWQHFQWNHDSFLQFFFPEFWCLCSILKTMEWACQVMSWRCLFLQWIHTENNTLSTLNMVRTQTFVCNRWLSTQTTKSRRIWTTSQDTVEAHAVIVLLLACVQNCSVIMMCLCSSRVSAVYMEIELECFQQSYVPPPFPWRQCFQ